MICLRGEPLASHIEQQHRRGMCAITQPGSTQFRLAGRSCEMANAEICNGIHGSIACLLLALLSLTGQVRQAMLCSASPTCTMVLNHSSICQLHSQVTKILCMLIARRQSTSAWCLSWCPAQRQAVSQQPALQCQTWQTALQKHLPCDHWKTACAKTLPQVMLSSRPQVRDSIILKPACCKASNVLCCPIEHTAMS